MADFTREIDRVEIWMHPDSTVGGARTLKLQDKTADADPWADITVIDTITLESRKKGGAATASFDSSTYEITITGDYVGIDFTETRTITDLNIVVLDNVTEYAVLMEVRAYKTTDVSDRVQKLNTSREGEPLERSVRASRLNLRLDNTDGVLSTQRTDVSGGVGDVGGPGSKFHVYMGYEDSSQLVKQGVYHVDQWREDRAAQSVNITLRDGAKKMSTDVNASYKIGQRHFEIVEYLANLAGIASTDMILDLTSGVIDYFATKEVDAYKEAQQVAMGAGFAELFFDAAGYLVFRATGNTGESTGVEQVAGAEVLKTYGPPAFLDDKMYVLCNVVNGANEDLKLMEYDIATSIWTVATTVSTKATDGGGNLHSGTVVAFNGILYIIDNDTAGLQQTSAQLYTWDGTTLTQRSQVSSTGNTQLDYLTNFVLLDRGILVKSQMHNALPYMAINLVTYEEKTYVVDVENNGIINRPPPQLVRLSIQGTDHYYYLNFLGADDVTLYRLWLGSARAKELASIETGQAGNFLIPNGMAVTGEGDGFYYSRQSSDGATDTSAIRISKVIFTAPETFTTTHNETIGTDGALQWSTAIKGVKNQAALALGNGLVVAGYGIYTSTGKILRKIMIYDEDRDKMIRVGSLHLSGGSVEHFVSTTYNGAAYIFGIFDNIRIFEMRPAEKLTRQTTSAYTISAAEGGLLAQLQVELTDESEAQSNIVNFAVVKSNPLLALSSDTLWQGDNTPWGLQNGTRLQFSVKLKSNAVPPQTLSVSYDNGGAANESISTQTQQPVITLDATADGRIIAISVTGQPLSDEGTLITFLSGSNKSLSRYGIRKYTLENNYIYDTAAQAIIASTIVGRFEFSELRLDGVGVASLLPHLELFDRVTLNDDVTHDKARTGVSGDFVVTAIRLDYLTQRTTLRLVEAS